MAITRPHNQSMRKETPYSLRLAKIMDVIGISQAQLARKSNIPQPTINRILKAVTLQPDVKTLVALGTALGSPNCLLTDEEDAFIESSLPPLLSFEGITIHQYEDGGRMGNGGLILQDQPGLIRSWQVTPDWLDKNVKGYTRASKLCIVTGFGDSMRPMFNPGDPLVVDLSIITVDFDAVYFFRVGHEGFIKRLQRIPGEGLRVLSANRDHYEPWTIKPDMDFQVIGRVLKVWRGDDC
jgi:transcriptional regulator with XRE-family HTH domain